MKRLTNAMMTMLVMVIATGFFCQGVLMAQPAPGMNGDSTLVGGGPLSGGVPLGSGLFFFLLFGLGYGIRKWMAEKRKGQ
ncbi:MAG: hypothetical protein PHD25_03900 [Bacteroidales bacterium]|nr:hypothetical protein [Bacteroidales bacterium]